MQALVKLAQVLVLPGALYLIAASLFITWLDRKLVARGEGRVGPPWFQPVADLIKLLAKEDVSPLGTDERMSALLPMVSMASTMAAGLCIPVGNSVIHPFEGDLIVVLFLLSVPTLAYFLAGWVTPSVYGVMGGNRSLLQYFSYEVPLLMSLAAPAIYSQSWSVVELMDAQHGYRWHAFALPVGFAVAMVGLIGKLKRAPFDIPHAESELGAGPLTEYSGRKLALWKLTVSLQTLVGVNLLVAAYLGGADRMWAHWGYAVYALKVLFLVGGLAFIQVSYARLRIDQMAQRAWRAMVPLGILQMLATLWMGRM